jgi:hypothetical protein
MTIPRGRNVVSIILSKRHPLAILFSGKKEESIAREATSPNDLGGVGDESVVGGITALALLLVRSDFAGSAAQPAVVMIS